MNIGVFRPTLRTKKILSILRWDSQFASFQEYFTWKTGLKMHSTKYAIHVKPRNRCSFFAAVLCVHVVLTSFGSPYSHANYLICSWKSSYFTFELPRLKSGVYRKSIRSMRFTFDSMQECVKFWISIQICFASKLKFHVFSTKARALQTTIGPNMKNNVN